MLCKLNVLIIDLLNYENRLFFKSFPKKLTISNSNLLSFLFNLIRNANEKDTTQLQFV